MPISTKSLKPLSVCFPPIGKRKTGKLKKTVSQCSLFLLSRNYTCVFRKTGKLEN
jgi:hypothetical protein